MYFPVFINPTVLVKFIILLYATDFLTLSRLLPKTCSVHFLYPEHFHGMNNDLML
jgi:hypothetical protein